MRGFGLRAVSCLSLLGLVSTFSLRQVNFLEEQEKDSYYNSYDYNDGVQEYIAIVYRFNDTHDYYNETQNTEDRDNNNNSSSSYNYYEYSLDNIDSDYDYKYVYDDNYATQTDSKNNDVGEYVYVDESHQHGFSCGCPEYSTDKDWLPPDSPKQGPEVSTDFMPATSQPSVTKATHVIEPKVGTSEATPIKAVTESVVIEKSTSIKVEGPNESRKASEPENDKAGQSVQPNNEPTSSKPIEEKSNASTARTDTEITQPTNIKAAEVTGNVPESSGQNRGGTGAPTQQVQSKIEDPLDTKDGEAVPTGTSEPVKPNNNKRMESTGSEPSDPRAFKPMEPRASEPTEPKAPERAVPRVSEPTEPRPIGPMEPRASEPVLPKASESREPKAVTVSQNPIPGIRQVFEESGPILSAEDIFNSDIDRE